jgi:excisionase family DNA binding protein
VRTFDIDECAEFFKVDRKTALKLAGKGELPGAKIGRAWVFLEDDLAEYLRTQVRMQTRQRQVECEVQSGLDASAARTPSMLPPQRGGRKKRVYPDLSQYDAVLTLAKK